MLEEKAKEQAEKQRLLANKTETYSKNREGWKITIFELPESDILKDKFVAECIKAPDKRQLAWGKNQGEAYSRACSFVDEFEEMEAKSRIFNERYAVMKYLYLMIIYISSTDQHNFYLNNNQEKSKENFTSVSCWNGFDFKIIDNLESEGLLELSSTKTTIIMNKKGIKAAREVLKMININGVKNILEQREYHEKYINYTSPLDFIQEEEEDT